jgi:hypothetical protein
MICPQCRSEYRAGFHRCATCGVDLVEEDALPARPQESEAASARARIDSTTEADLYPFLGFLSLDEARQARENLRLVGIPADILIRETEGEAEAEEFWIRVPRRRLAEVAEVLRDEAVGEGEGGNGEVTEGDTFACSECGEDVAAEADVCPRCGARFDT